MPSSIRVRWEYDQDPDLSYLEQWDTPEKYYDVDPTCPHCGSCMEYDEQHTFICCDEDCNKPLVINPELESGPNSGYVLQHDKVVPFEDYKAYWGDPSRHVTLSCLVETRCTCCGSWVVQSSCCGFDFMDTDTYFVGTVDAMDIEDEINDYQLEESHELILEAMSDDQGNV